MLHSILKQTVDVTFNKVTVDSDSSTNDTCIMLASGAAGADAAPIEEGSDAYNELLYAVHEVCETLARTIASDGEGASRLVTVNVTRRNGRGCRHGGARRGQLAAGQDRHRRP